MLTYVSVISNGRLIRDDDDEDENENSDEAEDEETDKESKASKSDDPPRTPFKLGRPQLSYADSAIVCSSFCSVADHLRLPLRMHWLKQKAMGSARLFRSLDRP